MTEAPNAVTPTTPVSPINTLDAAAVSTAGPQATSKTQPAEVPEISDQVLIDAARATEESLRKLAVLLRQGDPKGFRRAKVEIGILNPLNPLNREERLGLEVLMSCVHQMLGITTNLRDLLSGHPAPWERLTANPK